MKKVQRSRAIYRCLRCSGTGKGYGETGFVKCPVCSGTGELRQTTVRGEPGRFMTYRRPVRKVEPLRSLEPEEGTSAEGER